MTPQLSKASMAKIFAVLLLAEVLVFALGVMPEHISTFASHGNCEICALIHHPPALETGQTAVINLMLRSNLLSAASAEPIIAEPKFQPGPSRAPPSHI
jgi:hypothetical protein